jgi:eukaryotic-like serine/threonine-protein kinase
MAYPESDSESASPRTPSASAELSSSAQMLLEIAHVPPVLNALAEVELPSALRGLRAEALASEPTIPEPGALIAGRYRLDRVLGAGGMGVVFAAHHVQTDKPVALKWLSLSRQKRGSRDRAQALARFAREARAAGRIRHPNVVDVYDASSDPDAPYLVMERLEGETLRARIERAVLSWDELISLLVPAMRGVVELHRQGIVHRDLKPDNVFLAIEPGSSEPCAKVLDFGVSLLRSVDALEESLTGTGAIVGTPSYMPLEQLRGEDSVDARTDVYALGVVLFEALAGQRPWRARSAAEYGALLASERPTRLSTLRPELKGAREAAIMKALERDPDDRHASVEDFIASLLAATRPAPRARLWLSAALALGALVAFGAWQFARLSTPAAHSETVLPTVKPPAPGPSAPPAAPVFVESELSESPHNEPEVRATTAQLPTTERVVPKTHPAAARLSPRRQTPPAVPETALDALQPVETPAKPVIQPTDRATSLARDDF